LEAAWQRLGTRVRGQEGGATRGGGLYRPRGRRLSVWARWTGRRGAGTGVGPESASVHGARLGMTCGSRTSATQTVGGWWVALGRMLTGPRRVEESGWVALG
jgi:hypothetical protein